MHEGGMPGGAGLVRRSHKTSRNVIFQKNNLYKQSVLHLAMASLATLFLTKETVIDCLPVFVKEGQVCLANLQDGARTALSHLYGKPMKPNTLIKVSLSPGRSCWFIAIAGTLIQEHRILCWAL